MKLQSVIFATNNGKEKQLYYRNVGNVWIENETSIKMQKDAIVQLDTYFNYFSVNKWISYTNLENLYVRGTLIGTCKIEVWKRELSAPKTEICIRQIELSHISDRAWSIDLPCTSFSGIYYIKIYALSEEAIIRNMVFETRESERNHVKLAVITCTYHREAFLYKNMDILKKTILNNPFSPLKDAMDIIIVDNGNSLEEEWFSSSHIHVYPNLNTGGTGGFTRGLLEVFHKSLELEEPYTHIILMDDDIKILPEAFERTFSLLSLLDVAYRDAFIGGTMLRMDCPYIQEEAGGLFTTEMVSIGKGLDLRRAKNLIQTNQEYHADYNAWWYCCFPLSIVNPNNLPMPFFLHGDDIEFGLRNCRKLILLNGICVWHDTFENKRSSALSYYETRNFLIICALYRDNFLKWKIILRLFKIMIANIYRMRYKDVKLVIRGIEDFLKGPVWWKKENISSLHQKIIKRGYQFKTINLEKKNCKISYKIDVPKSKKKKAALLLNGIFFPKRNEPIAVFAGASPYIFYRIKKGYLMDDKQEKAILVKFSAKKTLDSFANGVITLARLVKDFDKLKEEYQREKNELIKEEYWKKQNEI